MTLTFSRMTVGDVDSAAAIALAAYGHPYGPHDIRRYLALQPDGWLMARIDGTPAAIGGITAYGNHAVVGLMATRPDFQRRGVATSLLATLLDYAGVWGVHAVALDATEEGAALSFKREASRDCGPPDTCYEDRPPRPAIARTCSDWPASVSGRATHSMTTSADQTRRRQHHDGSHALPQAAPLGRRLPSAPRRRGSTHLEQRGLVA